MKIKNGIDLCSQINKALHKAILMSTEYFYPVYSLFSSLINCWEDLVDAIQACLIFSLKWAQLGSKAVEDVHHTTQRDAARSDRSFDLDYYDGSLVRASDMPFQCSVAFSVAMK